MEPEQQSTEHHRRLSALIDLVNRVYGTEKMILKAGKIGSAFVDSLPQAGTATARFTAAGF